MYKNFEELLAMILLVDDEQDIRSVLSASIELEMNEKCIEASNASEAIKLLKTIPGIYLIASDFHMPGGNSKHIYEYNAENDNLPFLHLSTDHAGYCGFDEEFNEINVHNNSFTKPFDIFEIIEVAKKIKEDIGKNFIDHKNGYIGINIEKVKVFNIDDQFSLYIQRSPDKFTKLTNPGEIFSDKSISSYRKKGVEKIYFKEDDFHQNVDRKAEKIRLDFEKNPNFSEVKTQLSSLCEVQSLAKNFGISEESIKYVDTMIHSIQKSLEKTPLLHDIIDKIKKSENLISQKALLTAYTLGCVSKKLGHDSNGLPQKVITAALFCDSQLEDDHLCRITNLNSTELKYFSLSQRKTIRTHMELAIKSILSVEQIIEEEKRIIMEHHELPDGTGFPRGMDAKSASASCALFNTCYYFSHLSLVENLDFDESIDKMREVSFDKGAYKKVFEALRNIKY